MLVFAYKGSKCPSKKFLWNMAWLWKCVRSNKTWQGMIIIINQSNIFSSSVSLIARERKMYEINDNQFSVMMYTSKCLSYWDIIAEGKDMLYIIQVIMINHYVKWSCSWFEILSKSFPSIVLYCICKKNHASNFCWIQSVNLSIRI